MQTVRVRNCSGRDLEVLMRNGMFRLVRAGEHLETAEDHAASLAEQVEVWQPVGRQGAKAAKPADEGGAE